jgi:hypothetical protein
MPRQQVCLQLVQQFSSDKSSAVGMTLEFHRSCMLSWQQFGLKEVFTLCLQKLYMLQPSVAGACSLIAIVAPHALPLSCFRRPSVCRDASVTWFSWGQDHRMAMGLA